MMKFFSNKKTILFWGSILIIFIVLLGVVGWLRIIEYSKDKNAYLDDLEITYVGGNEFYSNNLEPSLTKDGGIKKEIKIDNKFGNVKDISIFLGINNINPSLKNEYFKWELYENGDFLTSSDFSSANTGTMLNIIKKEISLKNYDYTFYVWIDANKINNSFQNGDFSFTLYVSKNN